MRNNISPKSKSPKDKKLAISNNLNKINFNTATNAKFKKELMENNEYLENIIEENKKLEREMERIEKKEELRKSSKNLKIYKNVPNKEEDVPKKLQQRPSNSPYGSHQHNYHLMPDSYPESNSSNVVVSSYENFDDESFYQRLNKNEFEEDQKVFTKAKMP